mgnify:CR=1 FL=1
MGAVQIIEDLMMEITPEDKMYLNMLKDLINNELVLTTKDRIAPPTYFRYLEEYVFNLFKMRSFRAIKRVSRNVHYNNIRKFLAPLYYNYENELARLLYGEGGIQMRGVKG